MYTFMLIHSAKKEMHKEILGILIHVFQIKIFQFHFDIDSKCLLLNN